MKKHNGSFLKTISKKTLHAFLVVFLVFSLFALTPTQQVHAQIPGIGNFGGGDASTVIRSVQGNLLQQLEDLAGELVQCSIQQLLGNALGGILSNIGQAIFGQGNDVVNGIANQVLGGFAGGIIGQQAVPTVNPDIVDSINAQGQKEIGVSAGGGLFQLPSLDSIQHCLEDAVLQYQTEGAARFVATGFEGDPGFIQDTNRYFDDVDREAREQFLQRAQETQCNPVDQDVAELLARDSQVTGKPASVVCEPVETDETALSRLANTSGKVSTNPLLNFVVSNSQYHETRAAANETFTKEYTAYQGLRPQRDEEGQITVPPAIWAFEANVRIVAPILRNILNDETGEALNSLWEALGLGQEPGAGVREEVEPLPLYTPPSTTPQPQLI